MLLDVLEIVLLQSIVLLAAAGVIIQISGISRHTWWKPAGWGPHRFRFHRNMGWAANTLRKSITILPVMFIIYYIFCLVYIVSISGNIITAVDYDTLKLYCFMWHFTIMCVLVWMLTLAVWA